MIAKYYHPFRGGIETVQKMLAEGLVEKGHAVSVLAAAHTTLPPLEFINGVKVSRVPSLGSFASQPLTPLLRKQWRAHLEDCDVIHLHSPNPLAETLALTLPIEKPIVTTYHSDIVNQKFLGTLYRPMLLRFLRAIDRVIVPTEFHIKHSPVLRDMREHCTVIPFGIQTPVLDASTKARLHDLESKIANEYGRFFLFVGRMVPYKGVDVLLEALQRGRGKINAKTLLVGIGPLADEWQRLASELGVEADVKFMGSIDDDLEMLAYFRRSRALLLPSISRAEMFGMVLLEAMASGRPTITTRLESGVQFVAEEDITGFVAEPGDPASLAACMERMSQDDAACDQMGRAARERFERLFTVDRCVEAHLELYHALIAGRARRVS